MKFKLSLQYFGIIPAILFVLGVALFSIYFVVFSLMMMVFLFIKNYFISITVLDDRIEYETGIFRRWKKEIYFSKINNLDFSQNAIQKVLDVGSVVIHTGNSHPLALESVENVSELLKIINQKRIP